eukprot:CAMPEP_0194229180 /NCGR_PEP_ID=MMETSP0156-20130528/43752_1 /TAXON_ID=33649 /ORGANISM="Thalassionema nitzschioides, Strain L26-B" /LENGTH=386 /DNA_ID=CAMNT_0038961719 /DNA_START=35 /DNA_END=1195 /DNA_ORIENTATION=+
MKEKEEKKVAPSNFKLYWPDSFDPFRKALKPFSAAIGVLLVALIVTYITSTGTVDLWYRFSTSMHAFGGILSLDNKEIQAFIDSYEIFDKEIITPEDEGKIKDYYRVLNHLCALGEVEKMYIPPVYDLNRGVYENQLLFEEDMAKTLNVGPGDTLLELGCGRGRISNHMARLTGAKVVGVNIDSDQIGNARKYAETTGLAQKGLLEFHQRSFNDPLPFADNSFDGFYHVQALTYAQDLDKLFAELFRVVKPGAKISFLDWFILDAFDESNKEHADLLRKTKALIAAVYNPRPSEYIEKLQKAGFIVHFSKEASKSGHQYPLIQKARDFFMPLGTMVDYLTYWKLIPPQTSQLLDRLNLYVDDFIKSDSLGLFTTSWWIVGEKPLDN